MGKKVLLLGLGMQGGAVLHDLVNDAGISQIVAVDSNPAAAEWLKRFPSGKLAVHSLDVADSAGVARLMQDADIVIETLPGNFALPMGKLAGERGVSIVSSMYYVNPAEQDPARIHAMKDEVRRLDRTAREKGISILTEFGLDPGLDLMLGARAISELDEVREFHTYGAGIPGPGARSNPLQYKFSWSVIGVMRAYRRPARIIADGKIVSLGPGEMFEPGKYHMLELEEFGVPLECFPNGDSVKYAELFGIRGTVREMGRYTCRLPGHCAFWNLMVKCGFLDEKPLNIRGAQISPMEFTGELLGAQKQFLYTEDEQDMSFIRVDARGKRAGKGARIVYQILDERDLVTGLTSMQRTVGFTLSAGARLILGGKLGKRGLLTPLDVPYEGIFPCLEKHNIHVQRFEAEMEL